jgi:signal transduction histidine kinase
MIDSILLYSRLGTSKWVNREFSSHHTASGVISKLSKPHGVEVITIDTLPTIQYDQELFVQLLEHLLNNSIIHMGNKKGRIVLSCELIADIDTYRFAVEDDGKEIDKNQRERIFKPFQSLQSASESQGEHMGMGLTIAKKIVERGGGTIKYEPKAGKGNRFAFTVPVSPQER